jgi:hypothetical protein
VEGRDPNPNLVDSDSEADGYAAAVALWAKRCPKCESLPLKRRKDGQHVCSDKTGCGHVWKP